MMKYIVSCFLIVGQILGTTVSYAALSDADRALVDTGKNLLKNPGFENSSSYWTASGGATTAANSTAKGTGALGYDWDSNSAAQTLLSSSVTIPAGLQGKNGVASCQIKTVSGTATHTLTVNDGTNDIGTPLTVGSSTTSFQETKINFVFPTSGTIRLKLASVASNEPEIYIDDCKITLADNIYEVQQAKLIDVVKVTSCAGIWTTSSTTYATLGTQSSCVYTSQNNICTSPATNIPGIKCSSLPAGEYRIEYEGSIGNTVSGKETWFQFSDGTSTAREESDFYSGGAINSSGISQSIRYTSPQVNITFDLKGKTASAGSAFVGGTTANPGVFKVWYFPSASQQAVSSAQADYDWTSYTPTFTGFGTVSNVECFHSRVSENLLLDCKATTGTPTATEARVSLPNSLVSADTVKIPSIRIAGYGSENSTGSAPIVGATHSVLIEPSVGYVTFGFRNASQGALTKTTGSSGFTGSTAFSFTATIPIQGWRTNGRAPTLIGSVTSNAENAEKIERATISHTADATCAITRQSGSWISSVSCSTAGDVTLNFATGWSSPPSCVCTDINAYGYMCSSITQPTTSAVTISIASWSSATKTNRPFDIICMGPR